MNEATGLCRGCYRTLDEIARWGTMSDAERAKVIDELAARRAETPVTPSYLRALVAEASH